MHLTEGIRTPPIFRLWAGISTIAGVLQRRVFTYTEASSDPLCPNLYIILAGPPATGKSIIINETRKMWSTVKGLHIASDNFSKASFVAELQNATRSYINGSEDMSMFCSLAAAIDEFGVFIPRYDLEFLSVLTRIYDNPADHKEPRITREDRVVIRPNLNIIAGVAPDFMAEIFPEVAWNQGFTSRFLFIYSEPIQFTNKTYFNKRQEHNMLELTTKLSKFFDLGGEFELSQETQEAHISWLDAGKPDAPEHGRLRHYASRRDTQILKLAMISSVSSGKNLYIDIEDYERAREWLFEAELVMPDVFRAMKQKSDAQLIQDLWYYLNQKYSRLAYDQRVPIDDKELWEFLKERTTSPSIPKVIETAERSGVIRRAPGSGITPKWIPRPQNEHSRI